MPALGQDLGHRRPVLQRRQRLQQHEQVLLAVEPPLHGLAGRDLWRWTLELSNRQAAPKAHMASTAMDR